METNINDTKIKSELSSNRAVLKSLKKKILELNCLKTNITNIIIYVIILFIILVVTIIMYITTYNKKWLSRVNVKKTFNGINLTELNNLVNKIKNNPLP
jgi:hypothetical protein